MAGTPYTRRRTSAKVLAAVGAYWQREGYGPTFREIQEVVELGAHSQVKYHVDQLVIEGLLERGPWGANRTIRPSMKGWHQLGVQACPLCGSDVSA